MAVYKCAGYLRGFCSYEADEEWRGRCPSCGRPYDCVRFGPDSDDQKPGGYATLGGGSVQRYANHYISTGLEGFDYVLGGGLVAGRVVLLGGFPGAGKTRLLVTTADHIAKTQGRVIYASGEESDDDVNSIASDLGIVNNRVTVMGNQRSVEKVIEQAAEQHAFLVIYDSAQKFASDEVSGGPGSLVQCKAIGEAIKLHCGKTKTCAIIVNQMSKDGDLKGGTELEHHCDTIMVLAFPKDGDEGVPDDERGLRVLCNTKNRKGPEDRKSYWRMTEAGVLEHVPAKSKIVDIRSKYRRD